MIPNERFVGKEKDFWANVRLVGEKVGYSVRKEDRVRVPTISEAVDAYLELGLSSGHLLGDDGPTELARDLLAYFEYRAKVLNEFVKPRLMDVDRAKKEFERLKKDLNPTCPLPMNKQKKAMRAPAYLTGMVNMVIEKHKGSMPCDYDPQQLTVLTRDGKPLRTLARRVDGAFPAAMNPIAVWEIKEYYYTTTFGSRVADGVYESLLDGMELKEVRDNEGEEVLHYLIVDARYTWWVKGKSYLCRILDMLHMGYVDEVLFGFEVIERLPEVVKKWSGIARDRGLVGMS